MEGGKKGRREEGMEEGNMREKERVQGHTVG